MHSLIPAALLLLTLALPGTADGRIVHSEKSLYRNIVVEDNRGRRCMKFTVRRDQRNQSCKDLDQPDKLVFSYTRMMMAGLLLVPQPERVLMIGLGGGSLVQVLAGLYPEATIDVVEIDPAVVRVAEQYFGHRDTGGIRTHVGDGRLFIKRALRRGQAYDLILLDAFTGDYIPEHMVTREFLTETRDLLAAGGAVVANTFRTSQLADHESATYHAVFGRFWDLQLPDSNNRILIAGNTAPVAKDDLAAVAAALQPRLNKHGVRLDRLLAGLASDRPWRRDARVLTDQFAPANLLRAAKGAPTH